MKLKRKRLIAGVCAILCIFGTTGYNVGYVSNKGYIAEATYEYSDSSQYTHTIEEQVFNGNAATWTASNVTYSIVKVTVENKETGDKTVEYRVAVSSIDSSITSFVGCKTVNVPASITLDIATENKALSSDEKISIKDIGKSTVIANSACAGTGIKTIDLKGVYYIGNNAFSECKGISSVSIPASVKYMGVNVFANSSITSLIVDNEMEEVPDGMCYNTPLDHVTYGYGELIKKIGNSAFANTELKSCCLPKSTEELITIGDKAFQNCTKLTSIDLNNVVTVGNYAFAGCTSVTSLDMGSSLVSTWSGAFSDCTSLTDIKFSPCMTLLYSGAFENCTSLKNVTDMPDTLKDYVYLSSIDKAYGMGSNVFKGCIALESVELPNQITEIPDGTFDGCTALTDVTVNESAIETVGARAFYNCNVWTGVSLPNVKNIEDEAFYKCNSLEQFNTDNVETIGKRAFSCTKLAYVNLPVCEKIDDEAYCNCLSLKEVNSEATEYGVGVFSSCTGLSTVTLNSSGLTSIPDSMFYKCTSLVNVQGEFNKVKEIGVNAFYMCENLESLNFDSDTLDKVGMYAFKDCSKLRSICNEKISVTSVGSYCFENCSELRQEFEYDNTSKEACTIGTQAFSNSGISSVCIKSSDKSSTNIGAGAFKECLNLVSATVEVPENTSNAQVGNEVFMGCKNLKDATYTGNTIFKGMFENCESLNEVNAGNVKSVGANAFRGCISLMVINTSNVLTTVEDEAFYECNKLTDVHCNKSTKFDGDSNFYGCKSLKNIEIGQLTEKMFYDCESLESVEMASSIKQIPKYAFYGCKALKSIDLSNITYLYDYCLQGSGLSGTISLKDINMGRGVFSDCTQITEVVADTSDIGCEAFKNCAGLKSAILNVKSIEEFAFSGCTALEDVQLNGCVAIMGKAFMGCSSLYEMVVPNSVTTMGNKCIGYLSEDEQQEEFAVVGKRYTSEAYDYANLHNMTFIDESEFDAEARKEEREYKFADVNNDGVVSIADAVKLQSWLVKKDTQIEEGMNLDVNRDGCINVFDEIILKRKVMEQAENS